MGIICAISAHGLRLSQVTLYLGVYNRRMDGENVHKVYEKRKKSERGGGGGSLWKKSEGALAGEAAGDFLFFLSNPKKFLSATKPIQGCGTR